MTPRHTTLVDSSRRTLLLQSVAPLASLLSAVLEKRGCRQEISFGRYVERNASMSSAHENQGVIPPVVATGQFHVPVQSTLMPHAAVGG